MPVKPARPCRYRGCAQLTNDKSGLCEHHRKQEQQRVDSERGSSTERGYTYLWRRASKLFLAEHPLCAECEKENRITPASLVDHIVPHKGNYDLFWDSGNNWQSLCVHHHTVKTANEGAFGNTSSSTTTP